MPSVTAKEFLDRAKKVVWDNVLPEVVGHPLSHAAPDEKGAETLLNALTTGGVTVGDETGQVSVGPGQFSVTKGDFSAGGTFGPSKSGFVSKGPLRLDAGYGFVTPYTPSTGPENPVLFQKQQAMQKGPEPWVKLGFQFGAPAEQRAAGIASDFQSKSALDQAVAPFVKQEQDAPLRSARDEAEQFINDYRNRNQNSWWRP